MEVPFDNTPTDAIRRWAEFANASQVQLGVGILPVDIIVYVGEFKDRLTVRPQRVLRWNVSGGRHSDAELGNIDNGAIVREEDANIECWGLPIVRDFNLATAVR